MNRKEANLAVAYANQIDARVQNTDANVDLWHYALDKIPADPVRQAILEFYSKPREKDYRPAIEPGDVKRIAYSKRDEHHTRANSSRQIERPAKNPPPPHIKAKLDKFLGRDTGGTDG